MKKFILFIASAFLCIGLVYGQQGLADDRNQYKTGWIDNNQYYRFYRDCLLIFDPRMASQAIRFMSPEPTVEEITNATYRVKDANINFFNLQDIKTRKTYTYYHYQADYVYFKVKDMKLSLDSTPEGTQTNKYFSAFVYPILVTKTIKSGKISYGISLYTDVDIDMAFRVYLDPEMPVTVTFADGTRWERTAKLDHSGGGPSQKTIITAKFPLSQSDVEKLSKNEVVAFKVLSLNEAFPPVEKELLPYYIQALMSKE